MPVTGTRSGARITEQSRLWPPFIINNLPEGIVAILQGYSYFFFETSRYATRRQTANQLSALVTYPVSAARRKNSSLVTGYLSIQNGSSITLRTGPSPLS